MSNSFILSLLFILESSTIIGAVSKCSPSDNILICRNVSSTQELLAEIGERKAQHVKIINNVNANFALTEYQGSSSHFIGSLDLSKAGHLMLSDHGFKDFSALQNLNASNTHLEAQIKTSWFSAVNILQNFDLSRNRLTMIQVNDLENLSKLEKLNLSSNFIKVIQRNAFSEMTELKLLNLSFNLLENIDIGTVPNLMSLDLRENLLETVPANVFNQILSLEELNIQYNNIKIIEDRAFAGLNRIKILNLSGNRITSILRNTFNGMAKSRPTMLDLSENNINSIEPGSFQDLSKLQNLNLSGNSLSNINNLFGGLRGLRRLYLENNDIDQLADNAFEPLTSLELLDLSGNNLQAVNNKIFGSSGEKLKKLFLSRNSIATLPGDLFQSTPNIDYLSVSFNELTDLDQNLFKPTKNLKKLHLGHNLLEQIPSSVANDLNSISELLIDHNKLTYFPEIITIFPNLVKVTIEGNPWQCPCLDEMLNFLTNRSIEYWRDNYYNGQKPVCVVTRVNVCVKDFAMVRREGVADSFDDQ